MRQQTTIREEELKNRVATLYFGKYDCTRIVGNIDFCVLPKRRDPRQMTFIPDAPILWAEAKNHPTDVCRMLAQLILTIGRAASLRPPYAEHSNRKVIVGTGENRTNVAKDTLVYNEFSGRVGTATREFYIQFFLRIYEELRGRCLVLVCNSGQVFSLLQSQQKAM